jgi:hypothetical protein
VVFKIIVDGASSILRSFCRLENRADGYPPSGWLTLDSSGEYSASVEPGREGKWRWVHALMEWIENVLYNGQVRHSNRHDSPSKLRPSGSPQNRVKPGTQRSLESCIGTNFWGSLLHK